MKANSEQYENVIAEVTELWQPALDALAEVFLTFGVKRSDLEASKSLQAAFLNAAIIRFVKAHGKQPSLQQAALLAGLQRKLVSQLLKGATKPQPRYTTAVLHYWMTRPPYCSDSGPLDLPLKGSGSFESLCLIVCGEMGFRNAQKELQEGGAVEIRDDMAVMVRSCLIPNDADSLTAIQSVSKAYEGLGASIAHNLNNEIKHPQKITWSDQVPADLAPSVMANIREILDNAFAHVREVIIDAETADSQADKCYVTVGLYAHSKSIGDQ